MEDLLRDLRYGLRVLAHSPSVTAAAVVALALGIGANSAIFSVVNSVLLHRLPYPDEDRLVQIWGSTPRQNIPFHNISYSDFVDWKQQSRSFEVMAASSSSASANLILGDEPERVAVWKVNATYFPMLGARFLYGRGFLPAEDTPGASRVAVLSYALWQRRFGSDPEAVGSTINLDGSLYTVTGVLPTEYQLVGRTIDVYTPLALPDARETLNNNVYAVAFARLKPGVSKAQAQVELDTIGRRIGGEYPNSLGKNPVVYGLREFVVRDVRLSLLVLLAAVGFVLLIACLNVANLLLGRAAARAREIAVRTSLGASRGRIIRQLLTESSLLGLVGGLFGILVAYLGLKALLTLVPARYPLLREATIDSSVLVFTLGISLLTGLVFGIVPACVSSKTERLPDALKEGARTGEGCSRNRLLSLLVITEVSLALVLLIGAGLLIRSLHRLNQVNPGFNASGVLTASVNLPQSKYVDNPRRIVFFADLIRRLGVLPGVQAAGVVSALPLSYYNTGISIAIEGRPLPRPGEAPIVWFRHTNSDYFRAMQIPLLKGRLFTDLDDGRSQPVAVINETMARRFWPNEDPVGKRFAPGPPPPDRPITWVTVTGVVGDLRHTSMEREPEAEYFWHYMQTGPAALTVTIRSSYDAARVSPLLRKVVSEIDREQPVSQVRSMEEIVAASMGPRRFSAVLLSIFAGVALVLAAVGIYGVVSFSVTRRTREMGVRMALGAGRGDVLRLVVCHALAMSLIGVVAGLAVGVALSRVIRSLLYGAGAADPLIFAGVSLLLVAVAAVAGYFPARRASRVDPIVALRHE